MFKINCRNLASIEGVEGPLCLEAFGIKTQDHSPWWCWYYKHMSWYWCLPSMNSPPNVTLICAWYEFLQYVQQAFMFLLINTHSSCLFTWMSANHSSKFSFVWGWGWEIRGGERVGERQAEITRGDEEIKFHLTLKNLLYKTNYFSKESFHHCMAASAVRRNMIMCPR